MNFQKIRDELYSFSKKEQLDDNDKERLQQLLKQLEEVSKEEEKNLFVRQKQLQEKESTSHIQNRVDSEFQQYEKLAYGKDEIHTGDEALDHVLRNMRRIHHFRIIAPLISLPLCFLCFPLYIALLVGIIALLPIQIRQINRLFKIIENKLKREKDNDPTTYNYIVSLKKAMLYDYFIRFIKELLDSKDHNVFAEYQKDIDSVLESNVEEMIKTMTSEEKGQSLKKVL